MTLWKHQGESADWLAKVAFFEGFGSEELQRVVALSAEVDLPAGSVILDQGDAALDCYVIVEGTVTVSVAGEYVATLSAGTMIGEMALVDHRPRSATVVAVDDVRLLRFNAKQFRQLLEEMPKASERVMTLLHDRLTQ